MSIWQTTNNWIILFGAVGMTRDPIYSPPIRLHRRSWTDDGRQMTWVSQCGKPLDKTVSFANYRGRTFRFCLGCFTSSGYAEVHVKQNWLDAHRPIQPKLGVLDV